MARLRTRTVFSDERLSVTAVESLEFRADRTSQKGYVIGNLEPIAIIVREPDKTYAIGMDAQPVDVDQLNLPET
jgi:hypothetical protein